MPIGILKYNLDKPEDKEAFELAQDAWKYKVIIDDLFEFVRQKMKYTDEKSITYEKLKQELIEIRNEYLD